MSRCSEPVTRRQLLGKVFALVWEAMAEHELLQATMGHAREAGE
jgi:hypothetical protein